MRLNEDEPLVWRDERSKVRKRKVRRRGRILEAGRLKAEKEFQKRGDGLLPDKKETLRVEIKSEHAGWMNFHT